jgi:hypothetical protein
MTTTKNHGGKRANAGRERLALTRLLVSLTPAQIEAAKRLGNGNQSAGVRLAIDRATSAKPQ